MCGIFGTFTWNGPLHPTPFHCHLTNLLSHRGPDGGGYWQEGPFFLGHRRLSIIDLQTGQQPMLTADGNLAITFNGEIYNYLELKEELSLKGHHFRTSSDTEVLLHGYREWKESLPQKLLGMFAFGIVNLRHQTLFLARDPFGEKPLLYFENSTGVWFASQLLPLSLLPDHSNEIDMDALTFYLCLNYSPGDQTLMKGIRRVQPGSWRLYNGKDPVQEKAYYKPCAFQVTQPVPSPHSMQDNISDFRSVLDKSVNIALRSDVSVGLFLSGGIDSSLIAESAVRQGRLKEAFCLDFVDSGFSEWSMAKLVADRLGLDLHRVTFSSNDLINFMNIVEYADDPLADSSALPVWTLAKEASRHFKVVISGDGGDELFAGYLTYKASLLHKKLFVPLPNFIRTLLSRLAFLLPTNEGKASFSYKLMRFLRSATFPTEQAHFTWNGTWMPHEIFELLQDQHKIAALSVLQKLANNHHLSENVNLHKLQISDAKDYLPNDILTKIDRMSMAHSLEVRAPLLNPHVAQFGFSLPDSQKISLFGQTKRFLREVASSIYGTSLAEAKKQGFSIPIHKWLRTSIGKDLLEDLFSHQSLSNLGILDVKTVLSAKADHLSGKRSLGFELWGLMVLIAWHRTRAIKKPVLHASEIPDIIHVGVPSK